MISHMPNFGFQKRIFLWNWLRGCPIMGNGMALIKKNFLQDQQRFHRCQTLGFKNGLAIQRKPIIGIGGERLIQVQIQS